VRASGRRNAVSAACEHINVGEAHAAEPARRHAAAHIRRVAGENDRFPKLGEVIVNAADLTPREKARILFRHAKSASLKESVKEALKKSAMDIIQNQHFTPERIRRLVAELRLIK
jgi:hypothetical protein